MQLSELKKVFTNVSQALEPYRDVEASLKRAIKPLRERVESLDSTLTKNVNKLREQIARHN